MIILLEFKSLQTHISPLSLIFYIYIMKIGNLYYIILEESDDLIKINLKRY